MRCTLLILIPFVVAIPTGHQASHPTTGSLAKRSPAPGVLGSTTSSKTTSGKGRKKGGLLGGGLLGGGLLGGGLLGGGLVPGTL